MNVIQKVSDITTTDLAEYLRLDEVTNDDTNLLTTYLSIAKTFVIEYTGRPMEEIDTFEDCVIVIFVLVQDMWDTRALYVDKTNLNRVVETILGMHSVNLL